MADAVGGAGAGTGTAAPAAAPSGGTAAPAGGAPAAAPVAKTPILFRPKDADRDFDISEAVEQHIREHRRKVVIDGQESEVDIEAAFRAASLEPASKKRFNEADQLRKKATADMARIQAADAGMSDPARVPSVLRKRLGDQKYEDLILREAKEILDIDNLKPEQRAEIQNRRKAQMDVEERAQKVAAQEHAIKQAQDESAKQRQVEFRKRIEREWPPLIKSHGVPDGFVKDTMHAVANEMREARKRGIQLTEREAIGRCAAELKRKIGATAAPPAPTVETIQTQPGREPRVEAPRTDTGQFKKKNGVLRPGDVLDRIERLGR